MAGARLTPQLILAARSTTGPEADLSCMLVLDSSLAQKLILTACPEAEWRHLLGSGLWSWRARKEQGGGALHGPHTTGRLKAQAWCRWTVESWQLTEDLGWRLGKVNIATHLAPILAKP